MKNALLSASLRERGLSQEKLAVTIGSSRAHVCQVLNNVAGRGYRTRKKLAALLTARELAAVGWDMYGQPKTPAWVEQCRNPFHVESSK